MTKGRKTTEKERVEIVAFCMKHGKDYPLTIQTYGVSYQQIYAWVRKYEEKGIAGLATSTPEVTAENILNREFYADRPNEKWLIDVTEFKYYDGSDKEAVSKCFS